MAEFCLDCFNELHGTHYREGAVKLDHDLCEGCGEWKPTIVDFYPWALSFDAATKKPARKKTTLFQDLKALIKKKRN